MKIFSNCFPNEILDPECAKIVASINYPIIKRVALNSIKSAINLMIRHANVEISALFKSPKSRLKNIFKKTRKTHMKYKKKKKKG